MAELQRALRAAGFNPGRADGVFGADTRAAVVRFQRAKGLDVDGVVGADTTAALRRTRNQDRFEPAPTAPATRPQGNAGGNRTAVITNV